METTHDQGKRALDKQFERVGWGLFLIMIGGLVLIPGVPAGTWLIGTGLIMLGINLARYLNGIRASTFTIGLGFLAIALGIAEYAGTDLPWFPLLLILIGLDILIRVVATRD